MKRLAALLFLAFMAATSSAFTSRRAFIRNGLLAGASILQPTLPANAYGEFEPGAKARRKAASASKSPSTAPVPRTVESPPMDLKSALGDYASSTSVEKKTKK